MRLWFAAAAPLVLAGLSALAQTAAPTPFPTGGADCGAAALQSLVGGPLPQTLPAHHLVRIFAEGDMVTMDHNPARLNILLDGATRSRILSITCG